MSEIAEEEEDASERRKSHSLVDCCQMVKPFLDFFFLSLPVGDQFLGLKLLCPHVTVLAWADAVMDIGQMLSSLY